MDFATFQLWALIALAVCTVLKMLLSGVIPSVGRAVLALVMIGWPAWAAFPKFEGLWAYLMGWFDKLLDWAAATVPATAKLMSYGHEYLIPLLIIVGMFAWAVLPMSAPNRGGRRG